MAGVNRYLTNKYSTKSQR